MKKINKLPLYQIRKILSEVDAAEIYKNTREVAEGYPAMSGMSYTFLDATNGEIKTIWVDWDFREYSEWQIVLEEIPTPIAELKDVDLLDQYGEEWDEYKSSNLSAKDFIVERYGEKELEERKETTIDCIAMENELNWRRIEEQLDNFYSQRIKNNIAEILEEKDISINKIAKDLNITYAGMHRLVNRESLDTTQLETLAQISNYLDVNIEELYK